MLECRCCIMIQKEKQKPWKEFLMFLMRKYEEGKKLSKTQWQRIVTKAIRNAEKEHCRRMFIIASSDGFRSASFAGRIVERLILLRNLKNISIVYVADKPNKPPESRHFSSFEKELKPYKPDIEKISYKESTYAMGRTYDIAVLDLTRNIPPNDLGRIIETVRGGGLVILLTLPLEEWVELRTPFHEYITTIPWTLKDVRGLFEKRLVKKFFSHKGIYIFDLDKNVIVHAPKEPDRVEKVIRKKPKIPEDVKLPKEIYEVALTQDQVNVLKALESLMSRPREEITKTVIITADRGRGKSAAVGLFVGTMAKLNAGKGALGRFVILVTAPTEYNVNTLFEFAERALRLLGMKPRMYRSPPEIRGRGYVIAYVHPADMPKILAREKITLAVVDEAAGIPVPILFKILNSCPRVIYSSTIHGYEGAGRGFSIRFMKKVMELDWVSLKHVTMEEPIRYARNDPIERWLFDALLLDAEPSKLDEEDLKYIENLEVHLEKVDLEEYFIGEKEDELRQFIGIYVFAHYRNEPRDLAIMGDAPHYEAYALKIPTGKIVTALLVAIEGGIPKPIIEEIYKDKAAEPSGHLIPVAIEKHFRDKVFPGYRGYRIVRIATHPQVMRKGLGSKALEELENIARKKDFYWVGAGFGANVQLLRFWLKNKFVPIHVSPMRHKVSGEYTTIVVKPLVKSLESAIREYYREFRIRFVEWLRYVHYDMDPHLARLILRGGHIWERIEKPFFFEPRLTRIQKERMRAYKWGILSYELVSDVTQELVKAYFIDEDPRKPELDEILELLIISRVLQARTWPQVKELLDLHDMSRRKGMRLLAKAVITLYRYFIEREIGEISVKEEVLEEEAEGEDYERMV